MRMQGRVMYPLNLINQRIKVLVKVLLLFCIPCSSALATVPPFPAIDFHSHFFMFAMMDKQNDPNTIKANIDQIINMSKSTSLGVITPTYNGGGSEDKVELLSTLLSEKIHSSNGKLFGFCGIHLGRPTFFEDASLCLSKPGMIGLKIYQINLLDSDTVDKFERVVRLCNERRAILLVHFAPTKIQGELAETRRLQKPSDTSEVLNGEIAQTEVLLNIMNGSPNASLIVAHSGVMQVIGLNGMRLIGNYYHSNPDVPRNIYADTSALTQTLSVFTSDLRDSNTKIFSALRIFGLERVVYGSDLPFTDGPFYEFWDYPDLSESEVKSILWNNGKALLNRTHFRSPLLQ